MCTKLRKFSGILPMRFNQQQSERTGNSRNIKKYKINLQSASPLASPSVSCYHYSTLPVTVVIEVNIASSYTVFCVKVVNK